MRLKHFAVFMICVLLLHGPTNVINAHPPQGDATYYVSSSSGNDGNDGLTPATAFATIARVNGLALLPGDQVRFQCGDTWRGEMLRITASGAPGSRITFSSYPENCANKPVISGAQPITGWTLDSGNIYVADLGAGANAGKFPLGINQVFENDVRLRNGRWPNLDANADGGYARIDSENGATITDSALPNVDWTGATAHIKGMRWYLLVRDVVGDSGDTLTLNTAADCPYTQPSGCAGWGYFLNNHFETLDQDGEWYFDAAANEVYLFSTGGLPVGISGSVVMTDDDRAWGMITLGVDLFEEVNYVTIENINVRNGYRNGVSTPTNYENYEPSFITIRNNEITNMDRTGIHLGVWVWSADEGENGWRGGNNMVIANNLIEGANHMGIDTYGKDSQITGNTISNIGLIENFNEDGMGCPHDSSGGFCTEDGQGIRLKTHLPADSGQSNSLMGNRLERIGGAGIGIYGHTNTLINNVVRETCYSKADCGAIGSFGGPTLAATSVHDLLIQDNLIIDVVGNTDGAHANFAAVFGFGLYIDHYSRDVVAHGNTVIGAVSHGILYQNSTGEITDNTLYHNASATGWTAQILLTGSPTYVAPMTGNIMYGRKTNSWTLSAANNTVLANADDNYFFHPYRADHILAGGSTYALPGWQAYSGMDGNSVENWFTLGDGDVPISMIFYNETGSVVEVALDERLYLDLDQNPIFGSLILQPFTSKILVDGGPLPLTLRGLVPSMLEAGSPSFTLTVWGSGFTENSVVRWNGADRATNFVSRSVLTADISTVDVAAPGAFPITVYDEIETLPRTFFVVDSLYLMYLPVLP